MPKLTREFLDYNFEGSSFVIDEFKRNPVLSLLGLPLLFADAVLLPIRLLVLHKDSASNDGQEARGFQKQQDAAHRNQNAAHAAQLVRSSEDSPSQTSRKVLKVRRQSILHPGWSMPHRSGRKNPRKPSEKQPRARERSTTTYDDPHDSSHQPPLQDPSLIAAALRPGFWLSTQPQLANPQRPSMDYVSHDANRVSNHSGQAPRQTQQGYQRQAVYDPHASRVHDHGTYPANNELAQAPADSGATSGTTSSPSTGKREHDDRAVPQSRYSVYTPQAQPGFQSVPWMHASPPAPALFGLQLPHGYAPGNLAQTRASFPGPNALQPDHIEHYEDEDDDDEEETQARHTSLIPESFSPPSEQSQRTWRRPPSSIHTLASFRPDDDANTIVPDDSISVQGLDAVSQNSVKNVQHAANRRTEARQTIGSGIRHHSLRSGMQGDRHSRLASSRGNGSRRASGAGTATLADAYASSGTIDTNDLPDG